MTQQYAVEPTILPVSSIPEGYVVDFLTQRLVRDTAEEYVRQNLQKALLRQYGYAAGDCVPEFRIKVGSSRRAVDIAVFQPGADHLQENIRIIVETKRSDTKPSDKRDGVEQLKSYMSACLNVEYGIWTNGTERLCLAKRQTAKGGAFEEIADIPAFGQTEEQALQPRKRDLRPATADNLLFAFRRCHNYIASNEGKAKTDAFWELLKIIFCKIEDERARDIQFFATPQEVASGTIASATKTRIQRLFAERVVRKYPSIFPDRERELDLNPSVVAYVVSQLQRFSLLASPVDVKGVAYEEIVGANLRGDRGEFFTPRNACRMAVQMLDPQPDERLLDPACGTGGFLITAMNHSLALLREQQRATWADRDAPTQSESDELYRRRHEHLQGHVFGLDLNPTLVRAAKMNMVMNNDGAGGLFQANSLANPHTWSQEASAAVPLGSIDVLFTNPPFGTRIVVNDEEILRQYDLAARWEQDDEGRWRKRLDRNGMPVLQSSQPPEILFIERCVQFLKPGSGRMAMVIPNGILNNPALAYVRHWLLSEVQLLAVVDMQRDLFQPKNDTQTSMVLMRRLSDTERLAASEGTLEYPIFMAIAEKVGHDKRGNTIFKRDEAGNDLLVPTEEVISEIDPDTGVEQTRTVEVVDRVVDDDLPAVAKAYREWLASVQ